MPVTWQTTPRLFGQCPQVPEDAHKALVEELRGRLGEAGIWLAGGLPQDRVLAGALLNQAAAVTGAQLLGGSEELLDASVDEVRPCCSRMASRP